MRDSDVKRMIDMKEETLSKKLYLVETVSIFRMRYVVEAREAEHANDEVTFSLGDGEFKEFSQHHVDECITTTREISETEFFNLFDTDNDYLASWPEVKKKEFINVIDYGGEE